MYDSDLRLVDVPGLSSSWFQTGHGSCIPRLRLRTLYSYSYSHVLLTQLSRTKKSKQSMVIIFNNAKNRCKKNKQNLQNFWLLDKNGRLFGISRKNETGIDRSILERNQGNVMREDYESYEEIQKNKHPSRITNHLVETNRNVGERKKRCILAMMALGGAAAISKVM